MSIFQLNSHSRFLLYNRTLQTTRRGKRNKKRKDSSTKSSVRNRKGTEPRNNRGKACNQREACECINHSAPEDADSRSRQSTLDFPWFIVRPLERGSFVARLQTHVSYDGGILPPRNSAARLIRGSSRGVVRARFPTTAAEKGERRG